jgi:hypothetical protein
MDVNITVEDDLDDENDVFMSENKDESGSKSKSKFSAFDSS